MSLAAEFHRAHMERRARLWSAPVQRAEPTIVPEPEIDPEPAPVPPSFPAINHNIRVVFGPELTAKPASRHPSIGTILRAVSAHYRVGVLDILSHRRAANIMLPRQVAMYLAKRLTPHSMPTIGRQLRRDHTTILHAVRKISALLGTDPELFDAVQQIMHDLEGGRE